MGKIAFVFSGQGDQHPGMGESLYRAYASAGQIFNIAEQIRPGTLHQCFNGTEELLKETKVTQPCIFAMQMAIAEVLIQNGIEADMTAGFSLGELSALTYAGVFDLKTGMQLVSERAVIMQEAAEETNTTMAAVLKLDNSQVEELCRQLNGVYPVNYNCPGQIAVAGSIQDIPKFAELAVKAGGRVLPIKVNAAFHSPYMDKAAGKFLMKLEKVQFHTPRMAVYSDYLGEAYGEKVCEVLGQQMNHPVLWERIIERMIADGADTFIEIGPGNTLQGLIRRIAPETRRLGTAEVSDVERVIKEIKNA